MRILITGATGNVGGALIRQLIADDVELRAISRKPDDARLPDGVEVVFGDVDQPDSITAAAQDVDAAFVMTAGQNSAGLRALAEAGVGRAVYLSALTVQTRPGFPVGAANADAERDLAVLFADSTTLRPGQFASNALQWRSMISTGTIYAPFPDVATLMIDPYDIAAVARLVLLDQDGTHAGAAYALTGEELLTTRERVDILGEVLQRDLRVVEIDRATARSRMQLPEELADAALELNGNPNPEETAAFPTVRQLLGRPPRSFQEWAIANRDAFA